MLHPSHVGLVCEFWDLRAPRARGGGAHPLGEEVCSTAAVDQLFSLNATVRFGWVGVTIR